MDSAQSRINKKFELLNTLKTLPKNCITQRCHETLKEAQTLFSSSELEAISKKLNIKFIQI